MGEADPLTKLVLMANDVEHQRGQLEDRWSLLFETLLMMNHEEGGGACSREMTHIISSPKT